MRWKVSVRLPCILTQYIILIALTRIEVTLPVATIYFYTLSFVLPYPYRGIHLWNSRVKKAFHSFQSLLFAHVHFPSLFHLFVSSWRTCIDVAFICLYVTRYAVILKCCKYDNNPQRRMDMRKEAVLCSPAHRALAATEE